MNKIIILVSIETKSMLQISDNGLNSMVGQSQNSYNSLTSIDGLYYRNPLENDFEDEELSLEYKTLEYVGQVNNKYFTYFKGILSKGVSCSRKKSTKYHHKRDFRSKNHKDQ